jgi:trk system potassium uptake protein TrkA
MNVVIVGCGRVGAELAYRLFRKGHKVSLIDRTEEAFTQLHPDFRGRTVDGEGLEQDVLHRAGIESADALVAVTNSDSVNAVVGHIAKTVYHIPTVVVRNYDYHRRPVLEAFNLQTVSPTSWGAQRIEELLHESMVHSVFSAGNGEVDIYEFLVPESWQGRDVSELPLGEECIAVAITRAGRAFMPKPGTKLEKGDVIHLSATFDGIKGVCSQLSSPEERARCSF